jgi:hypothetical protein
MVFTNAGVQELIDFLDGTGATAPSHISSGDDNTAATVSDTALGNEVIRRLITTTQSDANTVTYSMLIASTQVVGQTLREAGIFNASTSGTMFVRFTHANIAKLNTIEVEYTIKIKLINT